MMNSTMICYYCFSCIDLPVTFVDFHVVGFPLLLHQFCQREYVLLNDIYFDGVERKIFCNCADKLRGQVKSNILKKVVYSTV